MKIKTIRLVAAFTILLSFTLLSNAYACDDVIILEKAKNGEAGELKAYLRTCRLNEKNSDSILTKEEKEAQAKKDAATQAEIKRIRNKVKSSFRSTEDLNKSSRWNNL